MQGVYLPIFRILTGVVFPVYETWRMLQGISEQKLKPPSSRARLSLYWKQRGKRQYVLNSYHLGPPKSYSPPFVFRDSICQIRNAC